MYNFPIGILIDSLKGTTEENIKKATSLGVQGMQLFMTGCGRPENHIDNMTKERAKILLDMAKSNNMSYSAICSDFCCDAGFRGRFADPYKIDEKIEKTKRIIDYAKLLESNVITTHIGLVPEDKNCATYDLMVKSCGEIAEYAASVGAVFAIETGPESTDTLVGFMDDINSKGIGANFDPANLVMCSAEYDLQASVKKLGKYIVHTHAKDGIRLNYKSYAHYCGDWEEEPEYKARLAKVKDMFHTGDVIKDNIYLAKAAGNPCIEVPLGYGDVNWNLYLRALEDIGYRGFLTIEREVGDDPAKDIKLAVDFLHSKINML